MGPLLLATKNAGKLRELRELTARADLEWVGLDAYPDVPEAPETTNTFLGNATQKALFYARQTELPTLADDSGLAVDALGGAPGVHSSHYAGEPRSDARNNRKLVADLANVPEERRTARFCCTMVFVDAGDVRCTAEGFVSGRIVDLPRGKNGFGYDPHFLVPDRGLTMAELPAEAKNAISHRGMALRRILPQIEAWLRSLQ